MKDLFPHSASSKGKSGNAMTSFGRFVRRFLYMLK